VEGTCLVFALPDRSDDKTLHAPFAKHVVAFRTRLIAPWTLGDIYNIPPSGHLFAGQQRGLEVSSLDPNQLACVCSGLTSRLCADAVMLWRRGWVTLFERDEGGHDALTVGQLVSLVVDVELLRQGVLAGKVGVFCVKCRIQFSETRRVSGREDSERGGMYTKAS
jgi:hypothetical protein